MQKITRRTLLGTLAGMAFATMLPAQIAIASPTTYPNKSIRMVIPGPPGGATDIITRLVSAELSKELGQTVWVDNKPGASATIGNNIVAKSDPDGYTLLLTFTAIVQAPWLYKSIPYDGLKDLIPITQLARSADLFLVHKDLNVNTLEEFIELAHKNPDKYAYGTYGNGTSSHIHGEQFKRVKNIEMMHIPYRGASPALQALLAGDLNAAFIDIPIFLGSTVIMMPRWDAGLAVKLCARHRVSSWTTPPAMVLDFFSQPSAREADLSSLSLLTGGGAAMAESVALMLKERFGIVYNEGYGMTETASFLHCNPLNHPRRQCLGIETQGVDSRIVHPVTLKELPRGEIGELVTSGSQIMLGYWKNPEANEESFFDMDGKRFFRTGDLARIDEDDYFFMTDRLKRMINVSGYKVWPSEVENTMYAHPAIQEVCIVGIHDEKQGEQVRAMVVLKEGIVAEEKEIIAWSREHMAIYKAPRSVAFFDELPKSNTGKIMWRELQNEQNVEAITLKK